MKKNISNYKTIIIHKNLLGKPFYRIFLALQAEFGIAKRGGIYQSGFHSKPTAALVNEKNFLSKLERRQLIFSEPIFKN